MYNVLSFLIKKIDDISQKYKKIRGHLSKKTKLTKNKIRTHEFKTYVKSIVKYLTEFCFVVLVYGAIVNYIMYYLLDFAFNFKVLIAWGFIAYLIKSELPDLIQRCHNKLAPR